MTLRETSEHYARVVCRSGEHRLILCRDGIQWILQRRTRAGSAAGARWEAVAYCRTREGLQSVLSGLTGVQMKGADRLPSTVQGFDWSGADAE